MANLFGKPDIPKPEAAKPAPSVDDAQMRIEEERHRRSRRGRAATQLVGEESSVSTAAKTLTGN